jgi:hypothetical protein
MTFWPEDPDHDEFFSCGLDFVLLLACIAAIAVYFIV